MGASDRYCLRWNNHQGNLISVLDDLLKNQTLTDVTLGVEDGRFLKCHKIILATCSPYFRTLFIEVPTNHPMILLKDVGYTEVKAILEFMYKGEVSVAYDDMAALFQVAELLQVKGLVAGNETTSGAEPSATAPPSPTVGSTSSSRNGETAQTSDNLRSNSSRRHSTNVPLSSGVKTPISQDTMEPKIPMPTWPISPFFASEDQKTAVAALANLHAFLPTQSYPFAQIRDNVPESTSAQHKSKHKSGKVPTNREIPILMSVLNPNDDDENTRSSLSRQETRYPHHRNRRKASSSNDSNERRSSMDLSQGQRIQSPRDTDASMMDEDDKRADARTTYPEDSKYGITSCGTSQRQEIKRYKKYSRKDIWNAIAAVKGGLSANKAAELFSVPSRTLYDKIKKLGIPPTKHRRSDNSSSASSMQYDVGGDLSRIELENMTKVTDAEIDEPMIDNPASLVETSYTDIQEKTMEPDEKMEVSQKSPPPLLPYYDKSRPESPDGSNFKENANEAEDLSVSRRSSLNVIVSPNSTIEEPE